MKTADFSISSVMREQNRNYFSIRFILPYFKAGRQLLLVGILLSLIHVGAFGQTAPVATNVKVIAPSPIVIGSTLIGRFTYTDVDGDLPGLHQYSWYQVDDASGTQNRMLVQSKTGDSTFLVTSAYQGKYFQVVITPVSTVVPLKGDSVASAYSSVINSAPIASASTISGTLNIGEKLTASFSYADANNDVQNTAGTTYKWYRADNTSGLNKTLINTYTGVSTYTITATDAAKYLLVVITPAALTGSTPGKADSTWTTAVINSAPVASASAISGTLNIGQTLTASFSYADANNDVQNTAGTTYKWYRADNTSGFNKTLINTYTGVSTYTITATDAAKYLLVVITPAAATGSTPGKADSTWTTAAINSAPVASASAISGTLNIGEKLTASFSYADANNDLPNTAATTYKWYRADDILGSNKTLINTYTGVSTYTITATDAAKYLLVVITPAALTGSIPGKADSTWTMAVINSAPVASASTISGTLNIGETLTTSFSYADANNDVLNTAGTTYKWYRADNTSGTNKTLINTYTGVSTYTVTATDAAKYLLVVITPAAATGSTPGKADSTWTTAVINSAPIASASTISGTLNIGQTLTASFSYADVNSDVQNTAGTTYKWYRADNTSGLNKTLINTYTGVSTYTITATDAAKYLLVVITPAAATGSTPGKADSTWTTAVINSAPIASASTISGTLNIGQTLTASFSYADANSDVQNTAGTTYKWYRADNTSGLNKTLINTYTGVSTYNVTATDAAKYLLVVITPAALTGSSPGKADSTWTSAVINSAPVASASAITGTLNIGQTLTASFSYADANNDVQNTAGTTYKWYRADNTSGLNKTLINTYTGVSTYTVTATDAAKYLLVVITPAALTGSTPGKADSTWTTAAINSAPVASSSAISGTLNIGQTLTASFTYSDANSDVLNTAGTTYKWYRADNTLGTNKTLINTYTGVSTYTVTATDAAKYLLVVITPAALTGSTPGKADSTWTTAVINSAPVASASSISGTLNIGQTLTASFSYADANNDVLNTAGTTYKWYRADNTSGTNKTLINTYTGVATYTVTATDAAKYLLVVITPAALTGSTPGKADSTWTTAVINSAPVASASSISGTLNIGQTLTASFTYSDANSDVQNTAGTTYKWYRADNPSGLNKTLINTYTGVSTYTVTATDAAKYLLVVITPAALTGSTPGKADSTWTTAVINSAPIASASTISGTLNIGQTLTASFSYADANNDVQNTAGTTYKWYRADNTSGTNKTLINTYTGVSTYTVTATDAAKYLLVVIIPAAATGSTPGKADSTWTSAVINSAPVASASAITGTLNIGETLTASFTYSDANSDVLNTAGTTYKWYRADNTSGTNKTLINTYTGVATYTITATDAAKYLLVVITPAALTGSTPGKADSTWTTAAINSAPVASSSAISGTLNIGQTLTASFSYADANSDVQNTAGTTYKWYRADNTSGLNKTLINTYTGVSIYTITATDAAKYLLVVITPAALTGSSPGKADSTWTSAVINSAPVASASAITGTLNIGQTLTASFSYADANNDVLNTAGTTYKWYRADNTSGTNKTLINTYTGVATYTITATDAAKYLLVVITPAAATGSTPGKADSTWTGKINSAPVATFSSIVGTTPLVINQVLKATYTYTDVDGDARNKSLTIYKWYRADNTAGQNKTLITTRTGDSTYTISTSDASRYLLVVITPAALTGSTPGKADSVWSAKVNSAPVASSPSIFGITPLVVGELLKATYAYADADADLRDKSSIVYKWYRADNTSSLNESLISSKTADSTYTISVADAGKYLRLEISVFALTGTKVGNTISVWSLKVNNIPQAKNVRITGTQAVCKTLTGEYDYFDDETDLEGISTFRWLRAATFTGTKTIIDGATSITYTLTTADQNQYIFFEVTPIASTGSLAGSASTSSSTGSILNSLPNLAISGTTSICQGNSTLVTIAFSGTPPFLLKYTDGTDEFDLESSSYIETLQVTKTGTYKGITLTDNLNCPVTNLTSSATVTVNALPTVSLTKLNAVYNISASAVNLVGTPSGGTFTGNGVVSASKKFYPSIAGVSETPFPIAYIYTLPSTGCTNSDTSWVMVISANAIITGVRDVAKYCNFDAPFEVTGSNISNVIGTFSISGNVGLTKLGDNKVEINPSVLSAGTYTISYTYVDNVSLTITKSFTVERFDPLHITGITASTYCANLPKVKITGNNVSGAFSGNGIETESGNVYFYPSLAPMGRNAVYYSFATDYGCSSLDSVVLQVASVPQAAFAVQNPCWKGDSTLFKNTTVSDETISSWEWHFGDASSTEANNKSTRFQPAHLYPSIGDRIVSLMAVNVKGCRDTIISSIHLGDAPVAKFSWDKECFANGSNVSFTNQSTSVDAVSNYLWTIDGSAATFSDKNLTYNFTELNSYNVKMVYKTQTGCSDSSIQTIVLRPVYSLKDSVYTNNFDQGRNFWVEVPGTSNNWQWSTPSGSTISSAHSSDKAFYTSFSSSRKSETLVVTSPCFNFTEVSRPFIEMWINKNTSAGQEGAHLQYTTDGSSDWKNLGETGSGINWYNDNSISSFTEGQKTGWSGTSFGWIRSRNSLDELIGKTNIRFRLAYGSSVTASSKEGFAFDDVYIGRRTKTVLFEHFTNSSSSVANLSNTALDDIIQSAGSDAVGIQYHTSFPGTDSINIRNQADPDARVLSYGVASVPQCYLDGGFESKYSYNFVSNTPNMNDVNVRSLNDADFGITINSDKKSEMIFGSVTVKALKDLNNLNLNVYIAVVEDIKIQSGGTTVLYNNVLKKMLPSAAGTNFKINWTKDQTQNIPFSWNYQYVYDPENIKVVAFIQDATSNEIYQASDVDGGSFSGVSVASTGHALSEMKIYPNPATEMTRVWFKEELVNSCQLQVFDTWGKLIKQLTVLSGVSAIELYISDLLAGMYVVKVTSKTGNVTTSRLIVQ